MHLFWHYHSHRIDRDFSPDFWLYELAVWLHVLGRSLIAVFIPILLLQIGYELGEVIFFYLIYNLIDVPLSFLVRHLVCKIGARWVVILGKIWSIGFFVLLALITSNSWPLLMLLALFGAFYDTFYWIGHRFLFMKSTGEASDVGTKTGVLYAVQRFAGLIGPAAGAGILVFFNQQALIYVSIAILVMSVFPLLKVNDFPDKPAKKPLPLKVFFAKWRERKNFLSAGFFSIHGSAEGVLWPLFIFVVFKTIESVAIVPVIISITAIAFSYFAGYFQRTARDRAIVFGAALIALVWIARMVVDAELFLFVSVFLVSTFSILVTIPLSSDIFSRGKKIDPLNTSTFMNVANMLAKAILYGILALFVNVFGVGFVVAVVSLTAIIAVHYIYLLMKGHQMEPAK